MSHPRYHQVPQAEETINLNALHGPNYNYNSGVPTSPPPSFHSSQSVASADLDTPDTFQLDGLDTPRLFPAGTSASNLPAGNEAMVVILQRRIDRLEETIGRLLIEKGASSGSKSPEGSDADRHNCCVHFSGDLSDTEMNSVLTKNNCCVTLGAKQRSTAPRIAVLIVVLLILGGFGLGIVQTLTRARPACGDCPNGGHGGGA